MTGGVTAAARAAAIAWSKPDEALDHRAPFGEAAIDADEHRKRALHLPEGVGGLHQPAELDGVGEIGRARHDKGEHHRGLRIAGGEEGELLLPRHDRHPVGDDIAEAQQQAVMLRLLAVEQGDLLGILAHPHQIEAEVGLVALLLEIQRDQRAADQMRERGADDGVDQRRPQQIAGNIELDAEQMQRRRGRQSPQNDDEGEQRDARS